MGEVKALRLGMIAPDFTLKDDNSVVRSLHDYLGKKNVVLAFYPKDFTGGWTVQLRSTRDELATIEATDSVVLGISVDDVESHKKFQEAEHFGFSLLADTDHSVSRVYSGIREESSASNRMTFIIDKAGYVRAIEDNVDTANHGPNVVKLLKQSLPSTIEVGETAPDFIAIDQDGKTYQLREFRGKQKVVLAFYPTDFTPGWTAEVCSLRDESSRFAEHDAQIFGISVQDAQSHRKFVEEYRLNFPLLVDTERNLNLLFEAMNDADGESTRVTIVVSEEGHITHIDRSVRAKTHGKDLIDLFRFVQNAHWGQFERWGRVSFTSSRWDLDWRSKGSTRQWCVGLRSAVESHCEPNPLLMLCKLALLFICPSFNIVPETFCMLQPDGIVD